MEWRRCGTGWVSADGAWRVRGPLMGKAMFWLYRVGSGRFTPTGRYEDAVNFKSAAAAKRYAEQEGKR